MRRQWPLSRVSPPLHISHSPFVHHLHPARHMPSLSRSLYFLSDLPIIWRYTHARVHVGPNLSLWIKCVWMTWWLQSCPFSLWRVVFFFFFFVDRNYEWTLFCQRLIYVLLSHFVLLYVCLPVHVFQTSADINNYEWIVRSKVYIPYSNVSLMNRGSTCTELYSW